MTIMTGYLYDAEGRRVSKGTISAWSCDPVLNGFQPTDDHILDLAGEQVTEMGVGGTSDGSTTSGLVWHHTNVWAAGKLLATYDGDSATTSGLHFYFNDPLGTRRVQTDLAGNIEQKCSSLPFGHGETCGPTPTENLFTGKERDTESGNDYFGARYYSSAMGRFMSPDWSVKEEPVPYAKLDDPQTLNLYSYAGNNPLIRTDADGHAGSDLFYDGSTHPLTLYSNSSEELGSWHANNNVDSRASLGKLPDGTYPVLDQNSPHMHGDAVDTHDSNKQDSENGEYGPGGIFRLEDFKGPDGKMHQGVGVHAGREDKPDAAGRKGPDHATQGCVRSCDAAVKKITDTAKKDPLKTLTVQNNRKPVPPPQPKPKKDGQ
jgi:RHS repeat-associated protein